MKRIGLLIIVAVLSITFVTGCGSMKKGTKSPEELAALEDAAIRGEDIPLDAIPDVDFIEPDEAGITGVFSDVYFDYDKSQIRKADYNTLNKINKYLQRNPGVIIMIEGHCDERGSNEYNMALGEQRALSVRRYLISLGSDSSNLHTVSYGEEKPQDSGHKESAWAKNRRSHFLVAK